ncbi:MetQ/NlpA family ABC transporter substrate-binding protein [Pelistega ratti]
MYNKKLFITTLVALGCMQAVSAGEKLSVAATPVPAAEILEFMKPALAKEGVDLEVVVFTDYIQPNQQVAQKNIMMNCFQHKPHLDTFNKQTGAKLVPVGYVYVPPLGAYSHKVKTLSDLPEGASVAIPNDTTNSTRALLLLEKGGLIKLKDPTDITATVLDITENPKKLVFKELEAATLPRVVDDVDLAVINTNYALEAKLNPKKDALVLEDAGSLYANLCATDPAYQDSPLVAKLMKEWHSPATVQFIEEKYKGTIIPVGLQQGELIKK